MEFIAEGLEFPEGPIAKPDGSVILVEIRRRTSRRVSPEGGGEMIAESADEAPAKRLWPGLKLGFAPY